MPTFCWSCTLFSAEKIKFINLEVFCSRILRTLFYIICTLLSCWTNVFFRIFSIKWCQFEIHDLLYLFDMHVILNYVQSSQNLNKRFASHLFSTQMWMFINGKYRIILQRNSISKWAFICRLKVKCIMIEFQLMCTYTLSIQCVAISVIWSWKCSPQIFKFRFENEKFEFRFLHEYDLANGNSIAFLILAFWNNLLLYTISICA